MKQIYWNHTPTESRGQSLDVSLVGIMGAHTYRVTLHWDRSYSFQTRGEIAVLEGEHFKPLLQLHHHDMEKFAAYDKMEPPVRYREFDAAGKLPGLLHDQARELVELGARIIEN